MEEIWKDIPGYEGKYQVSNIGRVKSIGQYYPVCGGGRQYREGRILSQAQMPNGYLVVSLNRNSKGRSFYVHRLVALAFISNPNNYKEINHKDEDKTNNHVENLEWCEHIYNMRYGKCREKISKAHLNNPLISCMVAQYTKDGVLVAIYPSAQEAMRRTGIDSSAIRKCCLGRAKFHTAHGFIWKDV